MRASALGDVAIVGRALAAPAPAPGRNRRDVQVSVLAVLEEPRGWRLRTTVQVWHGAGIAAQVNAVVLQNFFIESQALHVQDHWLLRLAGL